jgi:hypothetical protein
MKRDPKNESRYNELLREVIDQRERELAARTLVKDYGLKKPRRLKILSLILIVLATGGTIWLSQDYVWNLFGHAGGSSGRAVLIDPLSETLPDSNFVKTTTTVLTSAGYLVDYYGPNNSTVQLFQDLPLKGYGLIIIRAHTSPAIFTGEPYSSSKYVIEQLTDQLEDGTASNTGFQFAITDQFVRLSMHGTFANSIIVNMGCSGLTPKDPMAAAFLDKGAAAYVGWDEAVSVTHTDASTISFVKGLTSGLSAKDAVSSTMKSLGPDPFYHASLSYLDKGGLAQQRLSERLILLGGLTMLAVMFLPVIGIVYGLRRLGKD